MLTAPHSNFSTAHVCNEGHDRGSKAHTAKEDGKGYQHPAQRVLSLTNAVAQQAQREPAGDGVGAGEVGHAGDQPYKGAEKGQRDGDAE